MAAKKPAVQVTADMIDKAAGTALVKDLVALAASFVRAGAHGPFATELPIHTACSVKDKGYRRHHVPVGTRVQAKEIRIGKQAGLIFVMPIEGEWTCDKGPVEWIELAWDDIINSFADLADRIESYLDGRKVSEIQETLKQALAKNPAMHKILSEGFKLAQDDKRQNVSDDVLQANPLFGLF